MTNLINNFLSDPLTPVLGLVALFAFGLVGYAFYLRHEIIKTQKQIDEAERNSE